MIKSGDWRGEKVVYEDGIGCCIWQPLGDDDDSGLCLDFDFEDLDDLITVLQALKTAPTRAIEDPRAVQKEEPPAPPPTEPPCPWPVGTLVRRRDCPTFMGKIISRRQLVVRDEAFPVTVTSAGVRKGYEPGEILVGCVPSAWEPVPSGEMPSGMPSDGRCASCQAG